MKGHIIALDQGTTSSRAIIFSPAGEPVAMAQYEVPQHYPQPGWVEHDPQELWNTSVRALKDAFEKSGLKPGDIEAIGVTNQRETAVVWDKNGNNPCNAIVWQCRRTADICLELERAGMAPYIKEKTGLLIDAYFTGTKFKWMFDNIPEVKALRDKGALLGGTVDSWMIWNLTGEHVSDHSNVSRTMLFDIAKLDWDDELCKALGVPKGMLPRPVSNSEIYGRVKEGIPGIEYLAGIPVCGAAGDQQAALFGQCCFENGMVKNTYGTGCFTVMNTGDKIIRSESGLVSTIGWTLGGKTTYALEGSVFNAGSTIQWLRDGLGIIKSAPECDRLAESVPDAQGVVVVPAFTGLGAPYWDMDARGTICGITRGTTAAHIARAVLDCIAFQTADLIKAMKKDCGGSISHLMVDGGASVSDVMMQFEADLLNITVDRPVMRETTASGAAYLAGLAAGVWSDPSELSAIRKTDRVFESNMSEEVRQKAFASWDDAIKRTLLK